jgi:hypothetical protein
MMTNWLLCREVPLAQLQFKVVCELVEGENNFVFDFLGVEDRLRLCYRPRPTQHTVRLVYVVCR